MTERDAFGRETGEDATGLGTGSPATAPTSGQRAGGGGLGPAARGCASLLVALLIVAAITVAVIVGIGTSTSTSDTSTSSSSAATAPTPRAVSAAPAPARPAAPPAGLGTRSLIREGNFARALRRLRGRGRLRILRVAPDRMDAQLVTSGGRLRNVQVTSDGSLRDLGTAGSGAGGLPAIPLARVDAGAPQRIVRAAARQAHANPSRVDYLVLLELPNGQAWNVYFTSGLHFTADAHGANPRRL